jgi:hypothetical protein
MNKMDLEGGTGWWLTDLQPSVKKRKELSNESGRPPRGEDVKRKKPWLEKVLSQWN